MDNGIYLFCYPYAVLFVFVRFFLGALLGYIYLYTRDLRVSMMAHFINNLFALVVMHLLREKILTEDSMNVYVVLGLFLFSIVFSLLLINYFVKLNQLNLNLINRTRWLKRGVLRKKDISLIL